MIDIHSHVVYDVDDGPSKIEDSIRMISEAEKLGIKEIISTLHFHENIYNLEKSVERFQKLSHRAIDFGIKLYLGYEIFINSIKIENLNRIEALTLQKSKYLLIEFPYFEFFPQYLELLYLVQQRNLIPIIAHPERCRYFIENVNVLDSFLEGGCMAQVDAASILGTYGRHSRNLAKYLIKNKKASFVASNAHFADDYSDWYKKAYAKVKKWAGEDYSYMVFSANGREIIESSHSSSLSFNIL